MPQRPHPFMHAPHLSHPPTHQQGRAAVPDSVKAELLMQIKSFMQQL